MIGLLHHFVYSTSLIISHHASVSFLGKRNLDHLGRGRLFRFDSLLPLFSLLLGLTVVYPHTLTRRSSTCRRLLLVDLLVVDLLDSCNTRQILRVVLMEVATIFFPIIPRNYIIGAAADECLGHINKKSSWKIVADIVEMTWL